MGRRRGHRHRHGHGVAGDRGGGLVAADPRDIIDRRPGRGIGRDPHLQRHVSSLPGGEVANVPEHRIPELHARLGGAHEHCIGRELILDRDP